MDERPEAHDDEPGPAPHSNGYARGQLAGAWTAWAQHEGDLSRKNAGVKIVQWTKVIAGITDGSIDVGSRSPLAATPVWATLEVATGGFATGALKAGGPLHGHETALLKQLGIEPCATARRQLNAYFLSEAGLAKLQSQLESGCYEINAPEEGALLVAAWLLMHGKADEARGVIEHIAPWFSQLRFFPVPTVQPRQLGGRVCLATAHDVIEQLAMIMPKQALLRQARAISVRTPLYDRVVSLFLETVEGVPPRIESDDKGAWTDLVSRKFLTAGGWPCKHYPSNWQNRAHALLGEVDAANAAGGRWMESDQDSYAQLCKHLRACHHCPAALTGREVGRIRLLLARYISKRGEPGSATFVALRKSQGRQANTLDYHAVAVIVQARLAKCPGAAGLDDIEPVIGPVSQDEARQWRVDSGTLVPRSIRRKVSRSRIDTVQALVGQRRITSADMLATVLPQISSSINAAGIADRSARQLYGAIYQAFRRRRSLLLLNLQRQVQLEELPWVAPLEALRENDGAPSDLARKTLEDMVLLTLTSFPQTVIPNKLLQELRALANAADVKLPLVEELAVDIFGGAFSAKFVEAAQHAAAAVTQTIYARYFAIDTQQVLRQLAAPQQRGILDAMFRPVRSAPPGKELLALCEARAGIKYSGSIVTNGMLIEQQQILTTQNLTVLVGALNIGKEIEAVADSLARACFAWICRELQIKRAEWHAQLIARKNCAYAWRQMIFFLTQEPDDAANKFVAWANDFLESQTPAFATRFAPALAGLTLAVQGKSLDGLDAETVGAKRFLAYDQGPNWLHA